MSILTNTTNKTHIEGVIAAAEIIKRGPNFFLQVLVDEKKVHINEWVPEEKRKELQYKKDNLFRCHFGDFNRESIESLPGKMFYADAKCKEENEYFFTVNAIFADAIPTSEPEVAIAEVVPEIKVIEEVAVEETPKAKKSAGKKKGPARCGDCGQIIAKAGHTCKKKSAAKASIQ
jgi:hypothetical protein